MKIHRELNTTMSTAENLASLNFDPETLREKYRVERDKRVRVDGNDQYIEVDGDFSHYVDDPYVEPGFTRDPIFEEVEDRKDLAIWILLKMAENGDVTPVTDFFRQICGVKDKFRFEECIAFAGR